MQTTVRLTSSQARRSWKHNVGLMALVVVTAVASTIFGLPILSAHPAPVAGHAASSDTLRLQQEVRDRDEAAAAAGWGEIQAAEQARAGANRTAVTTVIAGISCGADCLTLIWPSGIESTTSLSIAFDYASFCGCTIVMQFPSAAVVKDASAQDALKEQRIAEWTETYVTQLAEQGASLASRSSALDALDALDAAARQALKDQRIADWTEINVTQPTQGH